MNRDAGTWDTGFWDALFGYFHPQTNGSLGRDMLRVSLG